MSEPSILFVYNADSGLLNAMKDMIHKAAAPDSYPCSLCATTYGAVAMRPEWQAHVATLPYEALFLHRDEFAKRHPGHKQSLPAILLEQVGRVETLLGSADMPPGQTVPELIAALTAALAANRA